MPHNDRSYNTVCWLSGGGVAVQGKGFPLRSAAGKGSYFHSVNQAPLSAAAGPKKKRYSHRGEYPGGLVVLFTDKVEILVLDSFECQEGYEVDRCAVREAKGN